MNQKNIQIRSGSPWGLARTLRWAAFAFCLSFGGLLFIPIKTQAALRNPVPITIGTQYGAVGSMGQETKPGDTMNIYPTGWMDDNGSLRRSVYLQPETGLHLLVVAYVNFNSCSGNFCDLEFKVTCYDDGEKCADNGMNWTNALSGPAPRVYYRPASTSPTVRAVYPEYTLYVSPNKQDIWISYKTSVGTCKIFNNGTAHDIKTSVIKKLKWDAANKLVWFSSGATSPESTAQSQYCPYDEDLGYAPTSSSSEVGVAVQFYDGGTKERVWGIVVDDTRATQGVPAMRTMKLAYTDDFSSTSTWVKSNTIGSVHSVNTFSNYFYSFPKSLPKVVFFPIGTTGDPGLIVVRPMQSLQSSTPVACDSTNSGQGPSFIGIAQAGGTVWNYRCWDGSCAGGAPYPNIISPNFQSFPYNWTKLTDVTCPVEHTGNGEVAYDFSVASRPIDLDRSRIVIAFTGGRDNTGYENRQTYIELKNCIARRISTPASAEITCNNDNQPDPGVGYDISEHFLLYDAGQQYTSPSVGFYGDNAVVAARNLTSMVGNYKTVVWQETTPHVDTSTNMPRSNNDWAWTKVLSHDAGLDNASGNVRNVSVPANRVDSAEVELNSTLPPVVWNMIGAGQRIAFGANMGGTLLNPNTSPTQAAPVKGFGWASTFGWLALNCASVPDATCTPPNSLYGVGIGISASATTPASQPPFSPTSATTYPLGGHAFSDNLGFLSFERRDNVNTCDGTLTCGDTDPKTDYNPLGNPPGEAYHANTANTDALAKYDKSDQHIYGWGRFRSLCNYIGGVCRDKDNGWVRFRGYWVNPADATRSEGASIVSIGSWNDPPTWSFEPSTILTLDTNACGEFPVGNIVKIDDEYTTVVSCPAGTPNLVVVRQLHNANPASFPITTTVYNVTNQEYGVDAYWTGSNYEFSGWAWSDELGWIRFNPLIFIGYAWMETLFGNIYSGGDIMLPDAVDPSGNRVNKCGESGTKPCYVATYRIETDGSIQREIFYPGTAQAIPGATSAAPELEGTSIGGTGAPYYSFLNGVDRGTYNYTQWGGVSPIPFPSISSSTTVYRNFLGKIDLQALLTRVENAGRLFDVDIGINRLGNRVYEMNDSSDSSPPDWKASELVSKDMDNTTGTYYILDTQHSQVLHIPGNLTVDGASAKLVASGDIGATFTVGSTSGPFPVCPAVTAPSTSACALVVDPGGDNEEYLAYGSYSDTTKVFSDVTSISSPSTPISHDPDEVVRWVWRLPYRAGETSAQSTTIVVDGNLDIQYNIIATSPTGAQKITDTPTIAFIVKGDVQVGVDVTKITGAFVVLSKSTASIPDTTFAPAGGNGGSFFTSSDKDVCQLKTSEKLCRKLVIEGLLFARQFFFQRYGSLSLQVPGEQVIMDEKLFLNPPPGLEDVTKALPNPERQLP